MKQIMLHGANDWRLDDIPEPEPGPRDALVRIAACGICGTDTSYIHMGMTPGHPIPLGHEMAGTVEWLGSEVTGVAVGDKVVVRPSDARQRADGHRRRPGRAHPGAARARGRRRHPPVQGARGHGPHHRRPHRARRRRHAVGEPVRRQGRRQGRRVRLRPHRPLRPGHPGRPGRHRHRGGRPQPGPPRAGQDRRGRPRHRPHRGRRVGRAQAHPRHDPVHVRADRGHRHLHRGLGRRQRDRRRAPERPGRRHAW